MNEQQRADDQTWRETMGKGAACFGKGDLQGALAAFGSAVELLPHRAEGWTNLGTAMLESGNIDDAATCLQKAVSLQPDLMIAHLMLGDASRLQGNWGLATTCYRKAVELNRHPLSLNKLACSLRSEGKTEFAEGLLKEAIELDGAFSMARVNLATLQIDKENYALAKTLLEELDTQNLPPQEAREVIYSLRAVADHGRLHGPIAAMVEADELDGLAQALQDLPPASLNAEAGMLNVLRKYQSNQRDNMVDPVAAPTELDNRWPRVEALFRFPHVQSTQDYHALDEQLHSSSELDSAQRYAANLEPAIEAARQCRDDMSDPVRAELHLRHWHALACRGIKGMRPGHFKYTQNWVPGNPTPRRVEPALASGTFRAFIEEIYPTLPPGYVRAAAVRMAVVDLHLFSDGNSRVATTWMNRELEWAGLMPALLPRATGLEMAMQKAVRNVRGTANSTGDLSELIAVIVQGQTFALDIHAALVG